ncbi:MAG: BatA and WFA domain-containing protein [Rubripirellula sp.]|nr:BatA and WFA domain-containing protein [Rubripirellula sp.]MDF1844027.1 BatA and WFA domain-containing protein [Rubripirellula sp.]
MSWTPAFTSTLGWAILAAVSVGIIILYFLKLRREPVEVPSTYLWSQTIEDLHVNSLLQRLRRSLLLFLQLLAIAVAALALFISGMRGDVSEQSRSVFLLDNSASMQATDLGAGETRLTKAKRMIEQKIEEMDDTDVAMLVTFSDRPVTVQSFTSDRRRLRDALASVQATNQPTDILGALKAADGLANPRRSSEMGDVNDVQVAQEKPADLLIYSDGGFAAVTEFNLGNLKPEFVSIGTDSVNNLAITAFSAERNLEQPTEVQAFGTVMNLGNQAIETTATLTLDGEFFDATPVSLEPGDQTGLSFSLESEAAATLELKLDLDDDLKIDNIAYAGLTPLRNVSVLVVTEGNTPIRLGLSTEKAAKICNADFVLPSYLSSEAYAARAFAGTDDLIIFDRCTPPQMPLTNTFFIGALPPANAFGAASTGNTPPETTATESGNADDPQNADTNGTNDASEPSETGVAQTEATETGAANWSWQSPLSSVALVDVDRAHPMMRYLELYSLLIFNGRGLQGPSGSTDLMVADIGAVLVLAPRAGYQDLVLGFEIVSTTETGSTEINTNWYAERSWPVFMLNVLRYLAGAAEATGAPSHRPGETVEVRLENAIGEAKLRRVGGEVTEIRLGTSGIAEILATEQPGNYRIEAKDELAGLFAINLFDQRESTIAAAPSIEVGYVAVEAAVGNAEERKDYWRWALVAMLGVLAAEWWLYVKRVA